ncbi:MAG: DUF1801 domain-containing protein [Candidatus Nanopelagicaceae bacterium]
MGKFGSLEEYLNSLDAEKAETLESIIDYILSQFPQLDVKISWNVPQIHRDGKYVFGLAAFKKHLTLNPWSPKVMTEFKPRLKDYASGSATFQVPVDWKIEKKLLRDLVHARLKELEWN